jgi:hypothetical protein
MFRFDKFVKHFAMGNFSSALTSLIHPQFDTRCAQPGDCNNGGNCPKNCVCNAGGHCTGVRR